MIYNRCGFSADPSACHHVKPSWSYLKRSTLGRSSMLVQSSTKHPPPDAVPPHLYAPLDWWECCEKLGLLGLQILIFDHVQFSEKTCSAFKNWMLIQRCFIGTSQNWMHILRCLKLIRVCHGFQVALLSQSVPIDSASRYLFELTVSHHEEQLLRNFTEQLLARDAFLWVSVLEYMGLCARYLISILYSMNIYQSHVDCPDSWHHSWHLAQKVLNMGSLRRVRFSTVIYVYYMSLGISVGCWRAGGEKTDL